MKPALLLVVLAAMSILAACSSAPSHNPYDNPDAQRGRAGKATQELDRQ